MALNFFETGDYIFFILGRINNQLIIFIEAYYQFTRNYMVNELELSGAGIK